MHVCFQVVRYPQGKHASLVYLVFLKILKTLKINVLYQIPTDGAAPGLEGRAQVPAQVFLSIVSIFVYTFIYLRKIIYIFTQYR